MKNSFLQIDKKWLSDTNYTLLEKLIVAQIQEFERNGKECYITDQQLSDAFGVNVQQITRAIKRLADDGIVCRNTKVVTDKGRASKMRTLKAIVTSDYCLGSNSQNDREAIVKNEESNGQNDTEAMDTSVHIKDNLKYNLKENLKRESAHAQPERENANAPEKRESIDDLSEQEIEDIMRDYEKHVSYNDIKSKYNLVNNFDFKEFARKSEKYFLEKETTNNELLQQFGSMIGLGDRSINTLHNIYYQYFSEYDIGYIIDVLTNNPQAQYINMPADVKSYPDYLKTYLSGSNTTTSATVNVNAHDSQPEKDRENANTKSNNYNNDNIDYSKIPGLKGNNANQGMVTYVPLRQHNRKLVKASILSPEFGDVEITEEQYNQLKDNPAAIAKTLKEFKQLMQECS